MGSSTTSFTSTSSGPDGCAGTGEYGIIDDIIYKHK